MMTTKEGEKLKPTNGKEMIAFLESLSISERTNVHGALMRRGWAKDDDEARSLMNECGFFTTRSTEDGWEPGIT